MTAAAAAGPRGTGVVLCRAGDGSLHVFAPGRFMRVLHAVRRPGGDWTPWADDVPLGWTTPPVVAPGDDGSVHLFATQVDAVGHSRLSGGRGWSRVELLFGVRPVGRAAVGRNADGRLELFVRGASGGIEHNWQREPGGEWVATAIRWPGLQGLDAADDPAPAVARRADGRLALVACASDGELHVAVQRYPNGGFGGWTPLGARAPSGAALVADGAGRLVALGVTGDGDLVRAVEASGGRTFEPWETLASGLAGRPAAAVDSQGRRVVVARAADGGLHAVVEDRAGGGVVATRLEGGPWSGDPAAGVDAAGEVVVVARGADGTVRCATRRGADASFSGWTSLGLPEPEPRA